MDDHLTEVKEIANLLEEVEVVIPEKIIVYYTLKNLPKEYEIFKRMQIAGQSLPTYEQLEAKLISEETARKVENQTREDGEALFSHLDRSRRSQQTRHYQGPRNNYSHRHPSDSGGPSAGRSSTEIGAHSSRFTQVHKNSSTAPKNTSLSSNPSNGYQPKYRPRGPEKPRGDRCNFCGLDGHFERECDLRSILDRMKDYENRLLQQRDRNFGSHAHLVEEATEESLDDHDSPPFADQVVDACLVELNLCETPSPPPSWYLDSGATHHVSGDSSAFSFIQPTSGNQVKSAGGQSHKVTGIGNADIQLSSGEIKSFFSVLYTPGITKNLISVGTLTDQHKTLVFRSNGCFIIDNSTLTVEAFAPRENGKGLYRLSGAIGFRQPPLTTPCLSDCHVVSSQLPPDIEPPARTEAYFVCTHSQATLWHKRLGHFHTEGLQRMTRSEAVTGLPSLHFSRHTCTGCQLGKHTRSKLPKISRHSTSRVLELIHFDVCGPFRQQSLGGHRYFVTFIDDFSRRMWIYFLSHKSEVLTKFQNFVHLVESSTGQRVQTIRSDNGGEYTSTAFSKYCLAKGISQELPPPYTPERNGVAERRNRSLLDITRCLLLDKSLPGYLWAEAVKAAADILNLRSTKRHPDKTPEELFFGKKPTVRHLRIFGSPAFVHTPKVSRSKLAPRSEQCILLSFDHTAKAYRCFRPSTRKVFISRDLLIDETPSQR